ncbi:uncharacterized protein LOC133779469 [Humulus lupulus]|uniref:uncharacterized protein LOC133779469 n=1 Tax=Humulus lupulus TaxID=3486 RepID=UPI002B40F927|nr:uncharacterized protein LOC133779469 [Humulus lupulus]
MVRRKKTVQKLANVIELELPSSNTPIMEEERTDLEPEVPEETIAPKLQDLESHDDIDKIVEATFWKSALVCMVIGANPPMAVFEGFLKRIWGNLGIDRVAKMNSGFTMVQFRDEATRDMVLESGVIHFDKKPVILRPWSSDVETIRSVKYVPVWIRLPGLGLQYWGVNCLSALVSTIGTPIMVDKVTKARTMIKFARDLVDMEIAEHIPMHIHYLNERGQILEQAIEYEWLPTKCTVCKKLGHTTTVCKHSPTLAKKNSELSTQPSPVTTTVNELDATTPVSRNQRKQDTTKVTKQGGAQSNPSGSKWVTLRKVGMKKSASKPQIEMHRNSFNILQVNQKQVDVISIPSEINGQQQHFELEC